MQLFKRSRSSQGSDSHGIATRQKADPKSLSSYCGQHCILRQLYAISMRAWLPAGKLHLPAGEDNLLYLQPGFDRDTLTIPELRAILDTHNVLYPSLLATKKSQLVELLEENVLPKAKKLLLERDHARGASKASTHMDFRRKSLPPVTSDIVPPTTMPDGWANSRQVYRPLRPWQTRLIQLLPSQAEDDIPSCKLVTVEFIDMEGVGIADTNEVVTYDAISYVWGKTSLDSWVVCNGIEVPVCKSLAIALKHLSKIESQKYYWCDAICIDQHDSTERAQQVRNMLRIFEKAETVLAWMGELRVNDLPYLAFIKRDIMRQEVSAFESIQGKVHQVECLIALENLQDRLRRFTRTPWFNRTWIRQEVFAAENIVLHFEDFKMAFDFQSEIFWQWLRCDPAYLLSGVRAPLGQGMIPEAVEVLEHASVSKWSGIGPQFLIMAKHFRHHGTDNKNYTAPQAKISYSLHWLRTLQEGTAFEVTDPRDRVYALLGIIASPSTRFYVAAPKHGNGVTNGTAPKDFPVDYDKSVSAVYQDVMRYLITIERNLDCLCVFQDRRKQAFDMPSWVLDWRDDSARSFLDSSPNSSELQQALGKPAPQTMNGSSELCISGFKAVAIHSLHGRSSLFELPTAQLAWCILGQELAQLQVDTIKCYKHYVEINKHDYDGTKFGFWVPRNSMLDDKIVFAEGARTPLVLRMVDGRKHRFIGPAIMIVTTGGNKLDSGSAAQFGLRLSKDSRIVYPDWNQQASRLKEYILV